MQSGIEQPHGTDDKEEFAEFDDLEFDPPVTLKITYSDKDGRITSRDIDIFETSFENDTYYLEAFCGKRQDILTFRVDRIVNASTSRGKHVPTGEIMQYLTTVSDQREQRHRRPRQPPSVAASRAPVPRRRIGGLLKAWLFFLGASMALNGLLNFNEVQNGNGIAGAILVTGSVAFVVVWILRSIIRLLVRK